MKFSDMMGKGGKAAIDHADTATDVAEVADAPSTAPPVLEAPIRFGGGRSEPRDVAPAESETPAEPPMVEGVVHEPSIAQVMAELAPQPVMPPANAASDEQLDANAWLEGLVSIDDDLLPR